MPTKQETRIKQLHYLKNFTGGARDVANHRVFVSLTENPVIQQAHSICTFISYKHEVDTHQFIQWCIDQQKQVIAPRVEQGDLALYRFDSLDQCLPGSKGILEPPPTNEIISPQNVDVFIIPGLAFDMECHRLGYGKGYYDRLLSNVPGFKVGICFTNQVMFSLPHDTHDVPLDRIITDTIQISKM